MRAAPLGANGVDSSAAILDSILKDGPIAGPIQRLDASWIDQILALQDIASDGQTILRDREYLEAFFARGTDAIFGMVDQSGRLVGQATTKMHVTLPDILKDAFNAASRAERHHAIIGCVTVHPDCRGQGLMGKLIHACLIEAQEKGMTDAHARVKLGNDASLKNFTKKGFTIAATGPSPEDTTRTVDFLHLKF
jgi:N-acetylglutamate synthase-like GNAT family acetyltransferase